MRKKFSAKTPKIFSEYSAIKITVDKTSPRVIYYKKNSRENLMNIAIDIDDTLTNSFEYFQPFVSEFFGVTVAELKKRNISGSS